MTFQPRIRTFAARPTLHQAAIMQKFVRAAQPREMTVQEAYDEAERLLDIFRAAGVPDPYQAATDYEAGMIPLPEIQSKIVASTPVEKLKPLSNLAGAENVDNGDDDEGSELDQTQAIVPVAGEEMPEPEPNEEDIAFEAAVDAAAEDGDEDDDE